MEKEVVSAEKKQTEINLPEEKHDFIKNEQGFIVHMKDIKVLLKHLSTSINQQDWEAIKQDTKKLKDASPLFSLGQIKMSYLWSL